MKIELYSDGSATTEDKPGGYGWVMVVDGKKHSEGNGYMPSASNNDAEIAAAIHGLAAVLKFLSSPEVISAATIPAEPGQAVSMPEVYLVSDSKLVLGWADGSYRFKQLAKIDKCHKLRELMRRLNAKTRHVYGHTGDEHNERCDQLANAARKQQEVEEARINGETLIGTKKTGVICVWYKGTLKIVDLEKLVCEDYNRDAHGVRGSMLEIREEKSR